jgi:ribonuclease VapC
MVIDSSAVAAILFNEPERDAFLDAIMLDTVRLISSVNALEAAMVLESRKGMQGALAFDLLLQKAHIEVVAFTPEHWEEARAAWRKFGRGWHPAGLNSCDCCAYALARMSGEALLFKGNDFSKTDIARVPCKAAHRLNL